MVKKDIKMNNVLTYENDSKFELLKDISFGTCTLTQASTVIDYMNTVPLNFDTDINGIPWAKNASIMGTISIDPGMNFPSGE